MKEGNVIDWNNNTNHVLPNAPCLDSVTSKEYSNIKKVSGLKFGFCKYI